MPTKDPTGESRWVDPDDVAPLGRGRFERAEIREGKRVMRPARAVGPPKKAPKEAVDIGRDPDSVAHFRAGGPGWQSRINEALRKAAACNS